MYPAAHEVGGVAMGAATKQSVPHQREEQKPLGKKTSHQLLGWGNGGLVGGFLRSVLPLVPSSGCLAGGKLGFMRGGSGGADPRARTLPVLSQRVPFPGIAPWALPTRISGRHHMGAKAIVRALLHPIWDCYPGHHCKVPSDC